MTGSVGDIVDEVVGGSEKPDDLFRKSTALHQFSIPGKEELALLVIFRTQSLSGSEGNRACYFISTYDAEQDLEFQETGRLRKFDSRLVSSRTTAGLLCETSANFHLRRE